MVGNTQGVIDKLNANREDDISSIEPISLADTEIDDLVAFLATLTDPCVESRACLKQWVPDASNTHPHKCNRRRG
jgi:cytochrome c peroxidase